MQKTTRDLDEVTRRIARLERSNRGLTLAVVLLVCSVLLAAARPSIPETLQAQRIQLVDDDGRVRIDLRHDDAETGVFIQDAVGDTRLGAAHFAHGGTGYALHGPGGQGAAVLYLKGTGSLTMYDAVGNATARFPGDER